MVRSAPIKRMLSQSFLISACLLGMPANASDPQTQMENKAFKEAVRRSKTKIMPMP